MEWMLMPLRRYADFNGRSRRMEYWLFTLGVTIVFVVVGVVAGMIVGASAGVNADGSVSSGAIGGSMLVVGLLLVLGLAILVPALAVQVRRFHDQGLSGWLVLINLIPYLGGLIVLVFMCLPGTVGPNKYGEDPLAGERADAGATSGY